MELPFQNVFKHLHAVNILVRCEHILYFLWDRFKHIGYSHFLEIVTTSKKFIPFHDHGVVVFRLGRCRNESSRNTDLSYFLVKGGS